ncbi:hypothetical protein [Mixta gaviniae]|uniref:hypothetical protein n=1 Tax=Mixta gaviniae TaxID=665914 RepID=UPI0010081205|nr:hypothetical protein [Mixta gaviniae]
MTDLMNKSFLLLLLYNCDSIPEVALTNSSRVKGMVAVGSALLINEVASVYLLPKSLLVLSSD